MGSMEWVDLAIWHSGVMCRQGGQGVPAGATPNEETMKTRLRELLRALV